MCLMLKCMQISKVQIQIHNQIWSSCFRRFLVLVMFTFCGHFVSSFDMVAELVRTKVQKIRNRIRSMTKTTSSSSGERKRPKWNLNLQEGTDINMFARDHRVPRVPQPTSFDGVKPSFLEWSEEVIAYLAVTDYHEFIPLLSAAAASKNVIEKMSCSKGSCQRLSRISTRSQLKRFKRSRIKPRPSQPANLKMLRTSQRRSMTFRQRLTSSTQSWSRKSQR